MEDSFQLLAHRLAIEGPPPQICGPLPLAAFWPRVIETEAAIDEATLERAALSANPELGVLLDAVDESRGCKRSSLTMNQGSGVEGCTMLTGKTIRVKLHISNLKGGTFDVHIPLAICKCDLKCAGPWCDSLCAAYPL